MRKRFMLCLAALIGLSAVAFAVQATDSSELLKTADDMAQITARLRGLQPKAPIARAVQTREEISKYLNEQVQKNYDEGKLQAEGKALQILGLIPAGIDYREFVIKLYTEQVGGYYNPEKKTFVIASWLPVAEQKPVMVHELTHALQDQYFDVTRIINDDRRKQNDDVALAHQALLEGEGMAVMLNYLLEGVKRHFAQLPDLSFVMETQMTAMQSQFPVFKSAPPYIQQTLIFPYGYGATFLQRYWNLNPSWEAVNKIYADLPSSTEQIMHPEKYFGTRDEPQAVNAEDIAARLGWKVTYKNVLGEFGMNLLLSLQMSEERAKRCAAGWDGDQVLLLEKDGKNAVVVKTVWDSPDEAGEFFQAIQLWFQKRFPNAKQTDDKGAPINPRMDGSTVVFAVGLPEGTGI